MMLIGGLVWMAVVGFAHSATDSGSHLDVISVDKWPELQRLDSHVLAKAKLVDIQYFLLKEPGPQAHVTAFTEDNTLISLIYVDLLNGGDIFQSMTELHGVNVKSVSPSSSDERSFTIMALMEDGSVFSRSGDPYMSGRSTQNSWEYGKIETLPPIKEVAIAHMFCMALAIDGTIFVWGRAGPFPGLTGSPRVLGLGEGLDGVVPTSICCTRVTCAFLTGEHEMLKWSGPYGNHWPRRFQELGGHAVKKIVCGMSSMMALTTSGHIFHIEDDSAELVLLNKIIVNDVVAGKFTFIIASEDGHAFSLNPRDMIPGKIITPTPVPDQTHPRDALGDTPSFWDSYTWGSARLDRGD